MNLLKICDKCGRQYFPSKFTPYQRYCKICKGKPSKVERKLTIPDEVRGLYMTGGKKQYWLGKLYHHIGGKEYYVYGKGFYSERGSLIVMKDGKEIGFLGDVKEKLKKILEGKLDEKILVER